MSRDKIAFLVLARQFFAAQAACHAQGVRLDESKVLTKRRNFITGRDLDFQVRTSISVSFHPHPVVKTLPCFEWGLSWHEDLRDDFTPLENIRSERVLGEKRDAILPAGLTRFCVN
jgi:hypothetical protein